MYWRLYCIIAFHFLQCGRKIVIFAQKHMKLLVAYAVEGERFLLDIPDQDVVFVKTGVGKVQAAMNLMRAIYEFCPDAILNVGTAGTIRHNVGDVFVCRNFIDRDLEKVALPGIGSRISFDNKIGISKIDGCDDMCWCNTGDSFVTDICDIEGDVVDMEAYAEAEVCKSMNIPFVSVKYVTDVIGQNSVEDWASKLSDARTGLRRFFES